MCRTRHCFFTDPQSDQRWSNGIGDHSGPNELRDLGCLRGAVRDLGQSMGGLCLASMIPQDGARPARQSRTPQLQDESGPRRMDQDPEGRIRAPRDKSEPRRSNQGFAGRVRTPCDRSCLRGVRSGPRGTDLGPAGRNKDPQDEPGLRNTNQGLAGQTGTGLRWTRTRAPQDGSGPRGTNPVPRNRSGPAGQIRVPWDETGPTRTNQGPQTGHVFLFWK